MRGGNKKKTSDLLYVGNSLTRQIGLISFFFRSLSSEKSVESPSWMDPNRRRKPKRASLPRTSNAVFTFGGSRDAEEEDVEEKEKGAKEKGKAEVDEDRVSIVRDSIRRSDQSDVQVPPGYTELYSKSTGLISYHDNVQDLLWFTALDQKGRLYFYTEGGRAEWKLPELPSKLATNQKKRRSKEEKEARGHRAVRVISCHVYMSHMTHLKTISGSSVVFVFSSSQPGRRDLLCGSQWQLGQEGRRRWQQVGGGLLRTQSGLSAFLQQRE